jgi:hypothetical protein
MAKKTTDDKALVARARSAFVIAQDLRDLANRIIDNGGEVTDDDVKQLQEWNAAIEVKGQNIAGLLGQLESETEYFEKIEELAKKRRKSVESTINRLRKYLAVCMATASVQKIKGEGLFSISLVDGRVRAVVDDESKLEIGKFADIIEILKPKTDAIKDALERGETVPGAHLEQSEPYITIR